VASEPLVETSPEGAAGSAPPLGPQQGPEALPFEGVRVLDLTRVLAGPTCTGFLAAWGADVLRLDPPSFDEVAALVPITAAGKRAARLDLASDAGREATRALVAQADVVVHGYRPGALEALGLGSASLHELRPGLVEVTLDAYGFSGAWTGRRGFDSLVQHTVGITALTQAALGAERPVALPCQALDHGAGWLMAAAVAKGLTRRCLEGRGSRARTSLARVARALLDQPHDQDPERPTPTLRDVEAFSAVAETEWGRLRRLTWPGVVRGQSPRLGRAAALGSGRAAWG
jgi:crotonobetainyl-CoA:carnitine CoA-transferase CaiB-like acyl-CoA transferase